MSLYTRFAYPMLCRLDAEVAHDRAIRAMESAVAAPGGKLVLRAMAGRIPRTEPVRVAGLAFPNVLGVAAGLDKDVRATAALGELGFGHVEVGTLTPKPQAGNPKPRIFRLIEDAALINRMGFPNGGVVAAVPRLRRLRAWPLRFVLGVSLGKQKETPLEDAVGDYLDVMRAVYAHADYLAVNISSPNTPGLRELQGGRYLEHLLARLADESRRLARCALYPRRPIFVKIAPDVATAELDEILGAVDRAGIDGLIATNTTLSREGLDSPLREETGGMSGAPLRQRSTDVIRHAAERTGGGLPIIGVGGVANARDVQEKLAAGAHLVQIYTGFVYGGPGLAGEILRDLAKSRHA